MKKVIYINEMGENVEFAYSHPYFLENIEGIDSLSSEIYKSKVPLQDGTTITGKNINDRLITIHGVLKCNTKDDISRYRRELIKAFTPKSKGKIKYINDDITKEIECEVEETPVFTNTSVSNLNRFIITLICPNPFWKDLQEVKQEIAMWVGDFSFPLELSADGIEMGHREPSLIVNVFNSGDVPTGMKIEFKALATVRNPSLLNVNTREYFKIEKEMVAGEVITVTTYFGKKRVELSKNGVTSNAFQYIKDTNITFLQLSVGDNLFRYDSEENIDNLEVSIYFTPQYLGV